MKITPNRQSTCGPTSEGLAPSFKIVFSNGLFVEALPACGALSAYGISNSAFGGRGFAGALVVPQQIWLQSVVFHVHAVASVAAGFAGWRPAGSLTAP